VILASPDTIDVASDRSNRRGSRCVAIGFVATPLAPLRVATCPSRGTSTSSIVSDARGDRTIRSDVKNQADGDDLLHVRIADELRVHASAEQWNELAKLPEFQASVAHNAEWFQGGGLNLWQRENWYVVLEHLAEKAEQFAARCEELYRLAEGCSKCRPTAEALRNACTATHQALVEDDASFSRSGQAASKLGDVLDRIFPTAERAA
jgi:hypothetical protein